MTKLLKYGMTGQYLRTIYGHTDRVKSVAFSKEGLLASGSRDRKTKIWDINTGSCLRTISGHSQSVECVAFNRDTLMATGSEDNTVRICNFNTGQCSKP